MKLENHHALMTSCLKFKSMSLHLLDVTHPFMIWIGHANSILICNPCNPILFLSDPFKTKDEVNPLPTAHAFKITNP
jgi:hypothetical protein